MQQKTRTHTHMHKMPLTIKQHTHILGGCITTSKLRTKRHNNTFLLLHKMLQTTNVGRLPMIGVDLSNTPIKDFKTLKPDITEATASQLPQNPPPGGGRPPNLQTEHSKPTTNYSRLYPPTAAHTDPPQTRPNQGHRIHYKLQRPTHF